MISAILISKTLVNASKINQLQQEKVIFSKNYELFRNTYDCIPGDCRQSILQKNIADLIPSGCFNINTDGTPMTTPMVTLGSEIIDSPAKTTCMFLELDAFISKTSPVNSANKKIRLNLINSANASGSSSKLTPFLTNKGISSLARNKTTNAVEALASYSSNCNSGVQTLLQNYGTYNSGNNTLTFTAPQTAIQAALQANPNSAITCGTTVTNGNVTCTSTCTGSGNNITCANISDTPIAVNNTINTDLATQKITDLKNAINNLTKQHYRMQKHQHHTNLTNCRKYSKYNPKQPSKRNGRATKYLNSINCPTSCSNHNRQ